MRIFLCSLLACSGLPALASAAADWSPRFFPRGPDREVIVLRASGNALYAGGAFVSFGPYVHPGLMRRVGQTWSPVGSGLEGSVRGIAFGAGGAITVSGTFPRADGSYGMAVWDGTSWSFPPAAKGLIGWGPIAAIGDSVYLVFETQAKEIFRWDGSDLVSLEAKATGFIYALEALGGELIAGGEFTSIGGVAADHVARFGTGWEAMAGGLPMTVRSLAIVDGALLAGGGGADGNPDAVPGLARWNGAAWEAFGNLPSGRGYIQVVAGGGGRIFAGGYLYPGDSYSTADYGGLAEWDGNGWTRIDDGVLNREIQTLAVADGELWAGGRFYNPAAPYLAHRVGKAWEEAYPSPGRSPGGPVMRMVSRGGRLIAAGAFLGRAPDSLSILAEWKGNAWSELGPGFPLSANAITFSALEPHGDDLFIGALFTGSGMPGLWRLSGDRWGPIADVQGVMALRGTPEGLYAGGNFTSIGNVAARHIARWDGAAWHAVGSGLDYPVTALEWDGSSLYAAEENRGTLSGIPAQVSRFSGGQWTVLGTTASSPLFNGTIYVLAAKGNEIWAAGEFAGNGLFNAKGVAVWNGSAWRGAGEGLAGVLDLAISPAGEVYAAGKFGSPGKGVAHWNGNAWESLGGGLSVGDAFNPPSGRAVACFGEDLFVAGYFDYAGGKPSAGLALWTSRPEELGLVRRARAAAGGTAGWRFFPDGRIRFVDPARAGTAFDAMGRRTASMPLPARP